MALIDLRNALMGGGKRLPYDAEVEYLQSTGTQWIDSGVKVYSDSNVEIGVEILSTHEIAFFGSSTLTDRFALRSLSGALSFGYGEWWVNTSASLMGGTMHSISTHQNYGGTSSITCDGSTTTGNYAKEKSGTDNFWIFNSFRNNMGACRISRCEIFRGSDVVFDGIPVRVGSVGYLYDRVSGALYGNAGTGDFVLGQDVVPVEYIEGHGTEWIDTGFKANTTTTTLETSIELISMSANAGLFGSRNNTSMANGASCNAFVMSTGKIRLDWASADANLNIDVQTGVQYEMSVTQGRYVLNGTETTIPISAQSYDQASNFLLFNFYNNTIPFSTGASAKMRYARLYSNSALVRKYLPVRIGTEGAMMDTLTRRIYRNAGTGAFTYGNDLKYPIPA